MAGSTTRKSASRANAGAKRANRDAEVTGAAIEIFWQKGYQAASIQDVADRVGVLKGSLYYYIDSKEDLLWRIIEDVHEEWTKILDQAGALDAGPVERIHAFIRLHVVWYLTKVKEIGVFFREWQHLTGDRLKTMRTRRRRYEQVVRDLLTAAQAEGEMSGDLDVTYATRYVLAAVNAVPDWYRASSSEPARIAESYADMTVGLLKGTRTTR
ncbi:MAG: TetR/AcrR family transcriptional regulator [Solirubrobacteraceae bacterium]